MKLVLTHYVDAPRDIVETHLAGAVRIALEDDDVLGDRAEYATLNRTDGRVSIRNKGELDGTVVAIAGSPGDIVDAQPISSEDELADDALTVVKIAVPWMANETRAAVLTTLTHFSATLSDELIATAINERSLAPA